MLQVETPSSSRVPQTISLHSQPWSIWPFYLFISFENTSSARWGILVFHSLISLRSFHRSTYRSVLIHLQNYHRRLQIVTCLFPDRFTGAFYTTQSGSQPYVATVQSTAKRTEYLGLEPGAASKAKCFPCKLQFL